MIRTNTVIGLIADTHGLLRPEALVALRGCHLIVHAGDIGTAEVLEGLCQLAPVVAIRGNNDRGTWVRQLPETAVVEAAGVSLYVLHNVNELALDPAAAGFQAIIAGHSHRPGVEDRQGVLFVNPGSAGPRRFRLPVTVACLRVAPAQQVQAQIVGLTVLGASSSATARRVSPLRGSVHTSRGAESCSVHSPNQKTRHSG
jgi:uncharacterized protein